MRKVIKEDYKEILETNKKIIRGIEDYLIKNKIPAIRSFVALKTMVTLYQVIHGLSTDDVMSIETLIYQTIDLKAVKNTRKNFIDVESHEERDSVFYDKKAN